MSSYGIQLYSVRDAMEKCVKSTLTEIGKMGYASVEFAGFFDHSAKEIKEYLEKAGLTCAGTHSNFNDLRPERIKETIAYHKEIGNPYFIIPGADLSTLEKIEDFCAVMNYAEPILKAEGIRLGYHNHSHEFALMPWGSTIHSEIERRTTIDFEIDIYWAYHAGVDPVMLIDRLGERVRAVHLKDGFKNGEGVPLGMGEAPLKSVIDYAKKHGIAMIVESETLNPCGLKEAEICINYLKNLKY